MSSGPAQEDPSDVAATTAIWLVVVALGVTSLVLTAVYAAKVVGAATSATGWTAGANKALVLNLLICALVFVPTPVVNIALAIAFAVVATQNGVK